MPDQKTILEENIYNSEYHIINPEVATIYKMGKDVITAHVRVDEECQTMESINLSSNRWEESYCEIDIDRSEEYHQTEMQKMSTSKLLSTRSKGKLGIHTSVMSNEINQK